MNRIGHPSDAAEELLCLTGCNSTSNLTGIQLNGPITTPTLRNSSRLSLGSCATLNSVRQQLPAVQGSSHRHEHAHILLTGSNRQSMSYLVQDRAPGQEHSGDSFVHLHACS
jgi:hypothetical protein